MDWLRDVSPADWIVERVHDFAVDVGSLVPDGFEAYARVFHPVLGDGEETHRWRDIAVRNGRIVHPEMQLHMINRPPGSRPEDVTPAGHQPGHLPPLDRAALVEILRPATTTPGSCWFAVWEGWGGLEYHGVEERIRLPGRSYLLTRGPIERGVESFHSSLSDVCASLWWPEDRAWFVATEIDLAWTYVGGSADVIDAIVDDHRIEAMPAKITDRFTHDADVLNAALDRS